MSFSLQNCLVCQPTVTVARLCIRMSFSLQKCLVCQLTVTIGRLCIRMSFSLQNRLACQLTVTIGRLCIRISFSHQNWLACQLTVTVDRLCIRDTNINTTAIVRQVKCEHIHITLCFTSTLIQGMKIENKKKYHHEFKTIFHTARG